MQAISAEQLEQMRQAGENFALINVLPMEEYRRSHIPGSDNIPLEREDFVQAVEQKAGSKDNPVVVYCSSEQCDASEKAARKLDEAGFAKTMDFAGGTKAWQSAGNDVAEAV